MGMDEVEICKSQSDRFIELCRQNGLSCAEALEANNRFAELATDRYVREVFAQKKRRNLKVIES